MAIHRKPFWKRRVAVLLLLAEASAFSYEVIKQTREHYRDLKEVAILGLIVALIPLTLELLLILSEAKEFLDTLRAHLPLVADEDNLFNLVKEMRSELRRQKAQSVNLDVLRTDGISQGSKLFQRLCHTQLEKVINGALSDLKKLEHHSFELPVSEDIPQVSFDLCEHLDSSAFCTSTEDQLRLFLEPKNKKEYLDANYAAAKSHPGKFTRIFILKKRIAINSECFSLMEEMHKNGVMVRIAFEHLSESDALNSQFGATVRRLLRPRVSLLSDGLNKEWSDLDYGLWDEQVVATIKGSPPKMLITAADDIKLKTKQLSEKLHSCSMGFPELITALSIPVNKWSDQGSNIVDLPPSDGPHEDDATDMLGIALEAVKSPDEGRIAILGLTKVLIQHAEKLAATQSCKPKFEVIDQREHLGRHNSPIQFRRAMWLDWKTNSPKHSIVGDDIFCNLAPWQLPIFFERMSDALVDDGLLIVRTTGVFDQNCAQVPSPGELVQSLIKIERDLLNLWSNSSELGKHYFAGAAYELAWPILHRFRNPDTSAFEIDAWNREVIPALPMSLRTLLALPHGDLVMTSMDIKDIRERSSRHFFIDEDFKVQSVWETDGFKDIPGTKVFADRFKMFYRILSFKKKQLVKSKAPSESLVL